MKPGILALACALALVAAPQRGGTEVIAPRAAPSVDESVAWYRARAAAGDAAAQYEVAHLEFIGLLPQSAAGETVRLLTAAAEAGNDQAALLLARLREFGFEGAAPDPVQAFAWYERVAVRAPTADLRATAAEASRRLRPRMTAAQLAQAATGAAFSSAQAHSP